MGQVNEGASATIKATVDERGAPVINLGGELDIATVPEVEAQLATIIETTDPPLTFDLSSLGFMDSSGIAMLLRAVEKTGPVVIRKPSRTVQQIIDTTGLGEILRVEP